ncbi:MAG: hypothetical protein WCO68_00680 [Verrucomicrobiota bacterium]
MRAFFLILSTVIALATFSGCQRKIKEANLRVLKPDMTAKEVESILGAPTRIEVGPEITRDPQTLLVTRHVYEQNGKKIELRFVGDRLATGSVNDTPLIEGKLK